MKTTKEKITEYDKLIAEFMNFRWEYQYKHTDMYDINGDEILEGSIINANGYNSKISDDPEEQHLHIVEYYDGQFGSDVYSDFDPLCNYQKIEVIGHITDIDPKYYFSKNKELVYHKSWNELMNVISRISECRFKTFPININIIPSSGIKITINDTDFYNNKFDGDKIIVDTLNINYFSEENDRYTFIESVWLGVVKFISWYNKNIKKD